MTAPTFSSWLVGSGSLLTECGEVLLRNGHAVCGVVAREGRAADWARARGFPVVDPAGDWAAELARTPFDHLFAITHLARVPEAVLRLPRGLAINFHDGPLPDYAGLNAPAWALWNGEPRYGITWHQMEPSLDAGPILVQALFDLAPDETAFSLNAKCFEAALDTFTGLVRELGTGTLRPVPQDLRRRRTFERHRRPPAAGAIDWTRPAKELESMVRALDFGRYANPLGVPKLQRAGQVLSVTRAVALEAEADEAPSAPGTVLAVEAQSVLVATGRGALSLRAFADLAGRPVEIAQAARRLGLAPGAELERIDPESARRLTELDQRMSRSERAWVDRLAALDPVALPFPPAAAPRSGDGSGEAAARAIAIAVPPALRERFPDQPPALVLAAALGAYCARLARRSELDLGYRDAAIGEAASGLEAFVEARLPLRVEPRR